MQRSVKVAIIGDYVPDLPYHIATEKALEHAAASLSILLKPEWISTRSLEDGDAVMAALKPFDSLWCAPGEYMSRVGAIQAIEFAREHRKPLIGTCGGFQYALIEFARNVLGIEDAEHEETAPNAPTLLITKLACSLYGRRQTVKLVQGSFARSIYEKEETCEQFVCNYGLNHNFIEKFQDSDLQITGVDAEGDVRIMELADHPFYILTLFQPQISSTPDRPHPLIVTYLKAAHDKN